MRVFVDRVDNTTTGYGLMGYGLEQGLKMTGHIPDRDAGLRVICAPPYALKEFPKGQEMWCMTMFESTRIPESFLEHLDNFYGVLCPNQYNVEQFAEFHPNVKLCPIGIDPNVWFPIRRQVDREIRFLHLGRGLRKGADLVERVFDLAFPHPEDMDPVPVLARHPIGGRLSEAEIVELYHSSHIYLGPSRGEGWNLLAFQGLATGMPTILTDIPGHKGFSGLPGALRVSWNLQSSVIGGAAEWWAGYWWDPDEDDLISKMRSAYEHYRFWEEQARIGGFEIWKHKTYKQMGIDFVQAVGDHERPAPGVEMVQARQRVFEVEIIKFVENAQIGDAELTLAPGKHFLTADQMRVLQNAGYAAGTGNWMHMWSENDTMNKR